MAPCGLDTVVLGVRDDDQPLRHSEPVDGITNSGIAATIAPTTASIASTRRRARVGRQRSSDDLLLAKDNQAFFIRSPLFADFASAMSLKMPLVEVFFASAILDSLVSAVPVYLRPPRKPRP